MTSLAVSTGQDPAEEKAVQALLFGFNAEQGWPVAAEPLRILLRGEDGTILGGLVALSNWRWLWVQMLAIPAELRGRGWGARLLAEAERQAAARGCIGVRLDTYSFQARGFYAKRGYAESGRIEDCPPGHVRYTMIKRLTPAQGEG